MSALKLLGGSVALKVLVTDKHSPYNDISLLCTKRSPLYWLNQALLCSFWLLLGEEEREGELKGVRMVFRKEKKHKV